jgi:secreted Zn-dependent insulinase-like peptidase
MVPSLQIHQDDLKQNVLLQLLALVAKQPAFHQLRSVEQLGYIALLRQRYGVLSLIMYYARCFGFGDK